MNVLEVFGEPIANGGQESFVIQVLEHMDHDQFRVDMLTPYYCDNTLYREMVESLGGQIYSFGLEFEPGKSRFNIGDKLDAFLRKHDYDVVHVHSGSISVLAITAKYAARHGVPDIIVHSHCAAEKKTLRYRLTKAWFYQTMMRSPTHYCACSRVAGEWKYPKSIVERQMVILKNGVDPEKYAYDPDRRSRIRTELAIPDDAFVLGHVGRFSYQKNHAFLVEIFASVLQKRGDTYLILIGDGETRADVERQVKSLGIEDKVRFCGRVDNVQDYLQAMDVFVLPSRYEGLPLVGVEAQAAGLPVVTSTNVSEELAITDLTTFLPLDAPKDAWADEVVKHEGQMRQDQSGRLREEGYDIRQTVAEIEKLYRN